VFKEAPILLGSALVDNIKIGNVRLIFAFNESIKG
jgi:hypothetical protein